MPTFDPVTGEYIDEPMDEMGSPTETQYIDEQGIPADQLPRPTPPLTAGVRYEVAQPAQAVVPMVAAPAPAVVATPVAQPATVIPGAPVVQAPVPGAVPAPAPTTPAIPAPPGLMPGVPAPTTPGLEQIQGAEQVGTVQEALQIEDPGLRRTALDALVARNAPGARVARDADTLASIRSDAAKRRFDAQRLYQDEVKRRTGERDERRARAEQAQGEARTRLTEARDELRNLRQTGERPLSRRQIAGVAMTALGRWLGSGGKQAVDVQDVARPFIEQNARAFAGKLMAAQELVAQEEGGVRDAADQRADADRFFALAVEDSYRDLANEFQTIAERTTHAAEKVTATGAAKAALAQAEAAGRAAEQQEIDRQIMRQEKAAEIAAKTATARKTMAEAMKAEGGLRGRGAPKGVDLVTDRELRALPKADRAFIRENGLRVNQKYMRNPDGSFVTAQTAAEAKDLRDGLAQAETLNDTLTKLYAARKKYGGKAWRQIDAKGRQTLLSLGATAIAQANKAMQLGALDNGTVEILEQALGDSAGFWDNLTQIRTYQIQTAAGVTKQLSHKANFRGQYQMALVEEVPDRTLADVWTAVEQQPDTKTGRHLSAEKRVEAGREALDLLAQEFSGDLEQASKVFAGRGERVLKQSAATMASLEKALAAERTSAMVSAEKELQEANDEYMRVVSDPTITGARLNEAETRREKAQADLRKATPPKYRALKSALDEERKFQRDYKRLVDERSKMLQQSEQLRVQEAQEARRATDRATQQYEAGAMPSGARGRI